MRVILSHDKYLYVENQQGLSIQTKDGHIFLSHQPVDEMSLVQTGAVVHIVTKRVNSCLHWVTNDPVSSAELHTMDNSHGLKLASDDQGFLHLIYVAPRRYGRGLALYHQWKDKEWSEPKEITANIGPEEENYAIVWGPDEGLILAYVNNLDGYLYYRVFSPKYRYWSGAVPLSRQCCHAPQMWVDQGVHLMWLEEGSEYTQLKYRRSDPKWQKEEVLSAPGSHVYEPGWYLKQDTFGIMWMQSGSLWQRTFKDGWLLAEQIPFDTVKREVRVIQNPDGNSSVQLACFLPATNGDNRKEISNKTGDNVSEETAKDGVSEEAAVQKETEEQKMEKQLIVQAFRIQAEWEKFKDKISGIERLPGLEQEISHISEEMLVLKEQCQTRQPDRPIVDLDVVKQRISGLEKRLNQGGSKGAEHQELIKRIDTLERRLNQIKISKSKDGQELAETIATLQRKVGRIDKAIEEMRGLAKENPSLLKRIFGKQ